MLRLRFIKTQAATKPLSYGYKYYFRGIALDPYSF